MGLYELHYAGFTDVDPRLEWSPGLMALRRQLEQAFEAELRARTRAVGSATIDLSAAPTDRFWSRADVVRDQD
ncbi:MAG: hypothetical protein H0T14_03505 [Nocardioidaceae bacterium]|nr:hypothetical protein [Nocardioidaceae bacterium]